MPGRGNVSISVQDWNWLERVEGGVQSIPRVDGESGGDGFERDVRGKSKGRGTEGNRGDRGD